jgi:hypothetical protein
VPPQRVDTLPGRRAQPKRIRLPQPGYRQGRDGWSSASRAKSRRLK